MANRNIDESLRKPRRARGTPFLVTRNYYALGIIAAGGLFWYLYELLPITKKLKHAQLYEGKFGTPRHVEDAFLQKGFSTTNASYACLLKDLRDREDAREDALYEDESKPQPCTPKISKYFSKVEEDAESPYKNIVSEVQSISFDDLANDDDFKSPPTKMIQLRPPKAVPKVLKKNLPRKSTRRRNPMQKTLEDNFKGTGVNGEHLQMALALSESSYLAENPENLDKSGDAQEKTKLFKQAFEKLGMRCGGKPANNPFEAPKLKTTKKSRYRFVTPILNLRTDEDRQSLLASKVSLLLARNSRFEQNYLTSTSTTVERNLPRAVHSDLLNKNLCAGFENFHLHSLSAEELTAEKFYVRNLNLTQSDGTTCGCLLKNWTRIPGRDISPSRQTKGDETEATDNREIEEMNLSETKNWTNEETLEKIGGHFETEDGAGEAVGRNEEIEVRCKRTSEVCDPNRAIELTRGRVEDTEESVMKTPRKRNSQNEETVQNQMNIEVGGYRTDSEDLETFAFSNLTELLRPSPEKVEVANERRSISPDLFDDTEDDISQSLISPRKISPASKNGTQRKNIGASPSSNIVDIDLTHSSEDEESNCVDQEKTSFIDREKSSWNLEIEKSVNVDCQRVEISKVQYKEMRMTKKSNIEIQGAENLTCTNENFNETKNSIEKTIEKNDVIEETPYFDFDATIILNESERNAHMCTVRRFGNEESEDNVETPDLGFDDYKQCADISRIASLVDEDISKTEANPNLEQTEDLNVTDYVMHILNNRNSSIMKGSPGNSTVRTELFPERTSFSQESITVSDDELNYSSARSKTLKRKVSYELSSSDSDEENQKSVSGSPKFTESPRKSKSSVESPTKFENSQTFDCPGKAESSQILGSSKRESQPEPNTSDLLNDSLNNILESGVFDKYTTPCSKVLIKTDNVTPMPDYDKMDTPKVTEALEKFGLKPLKRKKGTTFLKYIYESTHPLVEPKSFSASSDDEAGTKVAKKRRIDGDMECRSLEEMDVVRNEDAEVSDVDEEIQSKIEEMQASHSEPIEILGDKLTADEELVFERSQSKRLPSCRVPLQIVWHNFVSANPNVRENILMYEPLQLEVLHVMLKQHGYKFNIQDLLTFLDKKCITIRTNQTSSSGKRRPKKTC